MHVTTAQTVFSQYYREGRVERNPNKASSSAPVIHSPLPTHSLTIQDGPPKKSSGLSRKICTTLHNYFGAHVDEGKTTFRVFAPNAKDVSVIIKKNGVPVRETMPMTQNGYGVWEVHTLENLTAYDYQYQITTRTDQIIYKADPFSYQFQAHFIGFRHESVITSPKAYSWGDQEWMSQRRENVNGSKPLNIYEVYTTGWKRKDGVYLNYKEIATELGSYCKELGYTHVELFGILEYPNDMSWGYQASGYFAPTSRHGSLQDFQFLVDHLHQNGIGVALDFVTGHFCVDDFSLSKFDGTAIFEPSDHHLCLQPAWKTYLFAFQKVFVKDYLLSSANFWTQMMHIDIIRVDAVAIMSTLNETYNHSSWPRNRKGDDRYFEGRSFMKELTKSVHDFDPAVLVVAEDSSENYKNCKPHSERGFGFDMQWGFQWSHNLLDYFRTLPEDRTSQHERIVGCIHRAQDPSLMICLSHDDLHRKNGSLIHMMPGKMPQKFSNLRLLASFMMTLPPAKLTFMGSEIGQTMAWDDPLHAKDDPRICDEAFQREVLTESNPHHTLHLGLQRMNSELNAIYKEERSLWPDKPGQGRIFKWIDAADTKNSVISFYRSAPGGREVICVHNLGSNAFLEYDVNFPSRDYFPNGESVERMEEIFNSDSSKYGGSGVLPNSFVTINKDEAGVTTGFKIRLAPLSSMIFTIVRE